MSEKSIPFLQWVANKISENPYQNWMKTAIILPSRRSCVVLQEYLAKNLTKTEKAFILPDILPIQEFWTQLSGYAIPDKDILLLELFEVYQQYWPDELTIEDFLPWGRMMLSDFDEIDKYNVSAKKLFTIIRDEKEIDAHFSIDDELRAIMSQFWNIVQSEKTYEKSFIKTWEIMGTVYQKFKDTLQEKSIAYEGMAYRNYYERIKDKNSNIPYQNIHIVGFNAFTVIDEKLIKAISDHSHVSMYWDVDNYFMNHPDHEAGHFLRLYKTLFTGIEHFWNSGDQLSTERKYFLHGAPMHEGQVKVVAEILQDEQFKPIAKELQVEGYKAPKTGVVLCEEHIIESVLYEIQDAEQVNITMNFPVGSSAITEWLEILFKINQEESIHKSILNQLFKHYYFKVHYSEEQVYAFRKKILDASSFYFSKNILKNYIPDLLIIEDKKLQSLDGLCHFWINRLNQLSEYFTKPEDELKTILPYFIQAIQTKQIQLQKFESKISFKAIYQFMLTHIKGLSVPFLSEKSRPTQIMGFLETRLMDFDRVIIVGANEEILPQPKRGNSYIPYSLRKPFGLPTLKEYDGVYAYHFYRLLQRCKEAHLIYNNAPGDLPFEKSRFLGQIELELNTPENEITPVNWSYPLQIESKEEHIINSIAKTAEHIEKLKNREFSQSALILYLRCPMQFYLHYVAEIREPNELEEVMDAGSFGNVLHKAIEILYTDLTQQIITAETLRAKLPLLKSALNEAFKEEYQSYEELKGQNLLAYDMMLQSLYKIILLDISLAENETFQILHLEGDLKRKITLNTGVEITLQGKIDRVDQIGDIARIIDYKTGKVDLIKGKKFEAEKISNIFERGNLKTKPQTFQGLFYQYLMNESNAQVGFYSIRDLKNGIQYLNDGLLIPSDIQEEFENELKGLLEEILDPNIPFVQNENTDAYQYSPYQFMI
ncbi:MAG TPA: PD-(D/E)XK nuclease family protein [Chitinophagales bacterium]|nr:PD-(D/E)XK nuclease family protein [Chitinophagales bacterium]